MRLNPESEKQKPAPLPTVRWPWGVERSEGEPANSNECDEPLGWLGCYILKSVVYFKTSISGLEPCGGVSATSVYAALM